MSDDQQDTLHPTPVGDKSNVGVHRRTMEGGTDAASPWHQAVTQAAQADDIDTAREIYEVAKAGDLEHANHLGQEYLEPLGVHGQSAGKMCPWCDSPFPPRRRGGSQKRFCCEQCRMAFHRACRIWAMKLVDAHLLPVAALKRAAR